MYEATINGHKVRLANRDFESILKRFDVLRFRSQLKSSRFVSNSRACPLCVKYGRSCKGCPFDVFKTYDCSEGCVALADEITNDDRRFILGKSSVWYTQFNKDKAIAQLKLIHKELKAQFKKV